MKLCRYGASGREQPGLIDAEGRLRSLAGHADITPETLAPDALSRLAAIDPASLPLVEGHLQAILWLKQLLLGSRCAS